METPSSTRRITRSQTKTVLSNATTNISSRMFDDSENKSATQSRQREQERSVLVDITNDSPIVGLASGKLSKTPVSSMAKQQSSRCKRTPGSGEALLRGQVKNLLQKVEEEAVVSKFLSFETGFDHGNQGLKVLFNTPGGLLAPTPVNTPQVLNFNSVLDEFESLESVMESPIEDQLTVSKVMSGNQPPEIGSETEKDIVSRSLFLDFSDKSDSSSDCSSVMTYQGLEKGSTEKSPSKDDDDASVWSMQVNVSTLDEDEDEEEVIQGDKLEEEISYEDAEEDEEGEAEGDVLDVDELCEGIKNISVDGEKEGARFMGKHVRFVYNSDDELDATEVLHLKGLPTPQGKHLRFHEEEDE